MKNRIQMMIPVLNLKKRPPRLLDQDEQLIDTTCKIPRRKWGSRS
jgi:hypothetical protein